MADAPTSLERVTDFDDVVLDPDRFEWPVETPPFRDPDHRGLWHALQYGGMRGAQKLALALPHSLREALVRGVGGVARRVDRRHSDAARDFIRTALPELEEAGVERMVRESWRHLLRVAIVAAGVQKRVIGRPLGENYRVFAAQEALEALTGEGPCVAVTGHIGYWEASPPAVNAITGRPGYAVGKAPRNDYVARHVQRTREAQGMRLVPRNGAMTVIPAAVRAGAFVGLLLDHRPRQKPVFAPFFGRPAACDRSAGVLLKRLKVPLVFYGCYGLPAAERGRRWRFELRFPKVVRPAELAGLSPEAIATRVNRELEGLIRHSPDQYFWLHDRYKGAPRPSSGPTSGSNPRVAPDDALSEA